MIEGLGFAQDTAVEMWQSLVAFVVGFSVFKTLYAETGTQGLPVEPDLRGVA